MDIHFEPRRGRAAVVHWSKRNRTLPIFFVFPYHSLPLTTNTEHERVHLALGGLLLRLLEDLLDDLLLLDQEGTDDAVLDATGAAGTTVGTADVLLGLGDLRVLAGAERGDLKEGEKESRQPSCTIENHLVLPVLVQHWRGLNSLNSLKSFQPRHLLANPHNHIKKEKKKPKFHSGILTPGSLMPQSPHLGAVPCFLMWRYRSSPPGVLTTRTLLDRVLYL